MIPTPATAASRAHGRLWTVLVGHALVRIASSASGVLVGLYLGGLSNRGAITQGAALAGALGAVSYAAELIGSIPFGLVSDALAPRALMTIGSILGALATQLFGITASARIFYLSRGIEGLSGAAIAPSILAHLTDSTEGDPPLRARAMSYFELSLLAGLALGGIAAGALWRILGVRGFGAVALGYLAASALLHFGAKASRSHSTREALAGFKRALRSAALRRLAPVWLCVNMLVGLWLGPSLPYLLTTRSTKGQFLAGVFADTPECVGWLLLAYAVFFATGVSIWANILPRVGMARAMRVALIGMLGACLAIWVMNHSRGLDSGWRWTAGAGLAVCVMIESGFSPAALALLANAVGAQAGRGAAMGIYSVLLSVGAILGSLAAGWSVAWREMDGLVGVTAAVGVIGMGFVFAVPERERA